MSATIHTDLCIIGAGSGGLSVAAGAIQMGASVVLLERHRMGGDCLNTGCIPSKALIAAAHAAQCIRTANRFGIQTQQPEVTMDRVHAHVHDIIGQIEPHDSVARFEKLGCRVIQQSGRFDSPNEVVTDTHRIRAKRFVIATGSQPAIPPIPGLQDLPYFTNETIFDRKEHIPRLLVIGGGPIGLELAQAFQRLGTQVTILVRSTLMPKDDAELTQVVQRCLESEGITIHSGIRFIRAEHDPTGVAVEIDKGSSRIRVEGTHLLIATGRKPNCDALNLDAAGINHTSKGIPVDARLRTNRKHIFAIGDVAGPYLFTHMAGYQAGIVIRNALFRLPAKVNYGAVPWVTYTDPELAHVGMTEQDARQAGKFVQTLTKPFEENDRARAERETDGLIKVVLGRRGRILGASIVGPRAGELIQPWILAINNKMKIGAMATIITPYPTLGEINKGVAGSFYTPSLFSKRTRKIVRWLMRFS
ncbi:MAG: FAD-dependent oxidoreductase [Magnetococcales bacterium]|nr:FAD-dependent oxidoreductase [Magnetococcales bacterium]